VISSDRDAFLALGPAKGLDRSPQQQLFVIPGIARVAALLREGVGMLGYFESANDPAAARALLHEAARWLREQGARDVIGPMDGDTWHRYRVNAGPFETPPFLLEPVNPPYYAQLWEGAGFEVLETYSSKRIDDITPLLDKLAPMDARAVARGYRFRPIDPARLRDELTIVWRLSLEIFAGNAFYSDIALDDFLALYDGIERLLVPELVLFADDADGEPAGFVFAYPDLAPGVIDYKTIGVTPKHRRGYVGWALLHRVYQTALRMGRKTANHCLMREGNASQSMDAGHAEEFRRYLLYRATRD
jgi:GNAT superfamily N-acetyltransferase